MEHSREVSLLCPGQRRPARWRAFAWKRCCRWDQRIFYPCGYCRAFACSLIPDPPPRKRFLRTRVPPQWCVGKEGCGPYFVPLHDPRGKVVPLGRWCNIRGRGTLKPLHLTTYLFWFEPVSSFGSSNITTFNSTSACFHLGPRLSCSQPPCAAGSRRVGSRLHGRPCGRGYVVPRASDTVACRGRKLLTEQEVTAVLFPERWCHSS
jgi:hypothetical protein